MNIMPEKTPDIWTQIWAWATMHISNHNAVICGSVIAFFVSLMKSFLYGQQDTARKVLAEALLCSLIAGSTRPLLEVSGLDINLITPLGAGVGLIGTSMIRQAILIFVSKKTGVNNNENK